MRKLPEAQVEKYVVVLLKGGSSFSARAYGKDVEQAVKYVREVHPGHSIVRLHKGVTLINVEPDTSLFTDLDGPIEVPDSSKPRPRPMRVNGAIVGTLLEIINALREESPSVSLHDGLGADIPVASWEQRVRDTMSDQQCTCHPEGHEGTIFGVRAWMKDGVIRSGETGRPIYTIVTKEGRKTKDE